MHQIDMMSKIINLPQINRKTFFQGLLINFPFQKLCNIPWGDTEEKTLAEFIALHTDLQSDPDKVWPQMSDNHPYWSLAADYIRQHANVDHHRGGV